MPKVVGYHRPASLDEALGLLSQDGTVALAGGTVLNADHRGDPVVVVDLQALGLGTIEHSSAGRVRLGAMVTLQALTDDEGVPDALRDVARRELPSTLRTLATVGGTVAAGGWSSALLAAFLAHDAEVELVELADASSRRSTPLVEVLAAGVPEALIVAVVLATDGRCASARTGRTPGDEPIVAAYARARRDGAVRLALSGVAATPLLVDDLASIDPPGDFRGSSEYRRHVAEVLAARVRARVAA